MDEQCETCGKVTDEDQLLRHYGECADCYHKIDWQRIEVPRCGCYEDEGR